MNFFREDGLVDGQPVVVYGLDPAYGSNFRIICYSIGVELSGVSPILSDLKPLNQLLMWAHYQSQALRERGVALSQREVANYV